MNTVHGTGHFPWHSTCWIVSLMVLMGWVALEAQQSLPPSGSGQFTKFTIPERNSNGILIWQLTGDRAKHRPDGRMEIEILLVNTYRGTNVDWTLSTPDCILNQKSREAVSESDVRIFNKEIDITGQGFHWLANESRLIIRNHVQVIIHNGITKEEAP